MRTKLAISRQGGVVLPLALVMLVMVTLIAVVALRGVTTEERISANLRSSSIAFEQAELSLRYCEGIVAASGLPLTDARIDSTSLLSCRISRDTLSGRSFESMTPRTNRR